MTKAYMPIQNKTLFYCPLEYTETIKSKLKVLFPNHLFHSQMTPPPRTLDIITLIYQSEETCALRILKFLSYIRNYVPLEPPEHISLKIPLIINKSSIEELKTILYLSN